MEMASANSFSREDDFDRKLKDAEADINRIKQQQEELERKKSELEELTARKRNFVSQQVEFTERLTSSITLIDRELLEMRQDTNDLEECRTCFAAHLDKIQKFNPESWSREQVSERLDKATIAIDIAADEYDQAASHFEGTRSGAIFGRAAKRSRTSSRRVVSSEFMSNLSNGFAFNLPIVVLGGLALIVYLIK
jgi:Asp-tRNA(Asn)/Glu-tRNA(Gln) amidotransferase B subunit